MKKLLLAVAMGALLAAPAFAQSAATDQPGTDQYTAPSRVARNVMAGTRAPRMTTVPGTASEDPSSEEAYREAISNPRDWTASNPYNYEGGD